MKLTEKSYNVISELLEERLNNLDEGEPEREDIEGALEELDEIYESPKKECKHNYHATHDTQDGFVYTKCSDCGKIKDEEEYTSGCPKCGNPKKMYWCDNCESNQDKEGECFNCGHAGGVKYVVVEDEDYHDNCN